MSSDGIGLSGEARQFLQDPRTYVLGIVASWVVKNVFITPAQWVLAFIDWGTSSVTGALTNAQASVLDGLADAGDGILSVPASFHSGLENVIASAGLAAPLVTSLAVVVELALVGAVLYGGGRILIDIVPGGGGLIR